MGVEKASQLKILGFICQHSGAPAAENASLEGEQYPTSVRLTRVVCAADVDEMLLLRAIWGGVDGVFFAGCPLDSGYFRACSTRIQRRIHLWKQLLKLVGVSPDRVHGFWLAATEGKEFARQVNTFSEKLARIKGR